MNSSTQLHEIRMLKVGYFGLFKRHESLEKHILELGSKGGRQKRKGKTNEAVGTRYPGLA